MRVIFNAKYRDDGSMFVTSPSIPFFSAVAAQGDWRLPFEIAAQMVAINGSQCVEPERHYKEFSGQ